MHEFSDHRVDYNYTVEDGFVCIIDRDTGRSVTNEAEQVINELRKVGIDLESHRVIYRDTRGIWDEMMVQDGQFAGFKSINERDKQAAKKKAGFFSNGGKE